ncbi:glycosyltransferase family 9 protein [Desulfovibrio litoralis]|uniref:ADP-heptose:LPS heptosyltransferase n=1 Tax=Desulfovibrio litoralis DSM 11393 TaxID=1121455 RepID=A0A1M7TK16_9BACT|nr:glycosyltransferase family 9 protein [Desulfovibrio litoralis]SHN70983.1 ADP-heptose:LPS heptosyltransferase [Desulfovibrio litoralis DSM 11393]
MSTNPILIIQMQRMGDLILSFPLVSFLEKNFQTNPIWIVAEENYFSELLPISPNVTYFPYSAAHRLITRPYHGIINLSHRTESAELVKQLKHDWFYGYYLDEDNNLRIKGNWQIYRASLTHNNRHNHYHWSDLNILDIAQHIKINSNNDYAESSHKVALPHFNWAKPEVTKKKNARIGIFVGASQAEKHPNANFFAELVLALFKLGHKPVLLGGKTEEKMGAEICDQLQGLHGINLCGHFSIAELVEMLKKIDLFICPDTGPLHLASLLGVKTINLSLGNVSAFETGPNSPGHLIVSANLSCVGCWKCERNLKCHNFFKPLKIAQIANELILGREQNLKRLNLKGLNLYISDRNYLGELSGLYKLKPILGKDARQNFNIKTAFSVFWQSFFYEHLSKNFAPNQENSTFKLKLKKELETINPKLLLKYNQALIKLCRYFAGKLNINKKNTFDNFWINYPPCIRPLTSFCQLWLDNNDYSKAAYIQVLQLTESARL